MAATAATSAGKIFQRWGYIGDIFKNRMSKSDCNIYTYLLVLNHISIRQYMHKLYKST